MHSHELINSVQFPITALREIKLLKMLSHPNVLRLPEMAVEKKQGARHNYRVLLELSQQST